MQSHKRQPGWNRTVRMEYPLGRSCVISLYVNSVLYLQVKCDEKWQQFKYSNRPHGIVSWKPSFTPCSIFPWLFPRSVSTIIAWRFVFWVLCSVWIINVSSFHVLEGVNKVNLNISSLVSPCSLECDINWNIVNLLQRSARRNVSWNRRNEEGWFTHQKIESEWPVGDWCKIED